MATTHKIVLFFFFFLDYSLFFYALRQMLGISVYLGGLLFLLNNVLPLLL